MLYNRKMDEKDILECPSGSSGMNVAIIIWGKLMVFNSKRHFQEWLYAQQVTQ